MKLINLWVLTGLVVFYSTPGIGAESAKEKSVRNMRSAPVTPPQNKLAAARVLLIERMKASRQNLRDALAYYERELQNQLTDHETKKKLYAENLISRLEVDQSEQRLTEMHQAMEQIQQWITEDDIALALTPAAAEEESERLGALPLGGYDETASYIRYNGATPWSLADTKKIAQFFLARFGRSLPISALGQTATHERMGLDHRDAVDVPISPDSEEGRSLTAYLHRNGIPFIAFRRKVRSMSTGAHIHIGRPSPILIEVKRRPILMVGPAQSAEGG
jgi:hypothetical protein